MTLWFRMMSLALLVMLAACGKDGTDDGGGAPPPAETLEGSWTTEGYGFTFRFQGDTVTLYETTAVSCLKISEGPLEDGVLPELGMRFRLEGDRLVIDNGGTLFITGRRTPFPEVCTRVMPPPDDPVFNFEVFWRTFAEHYPFFDLHGVDWNARYETFRPRVSAATTDAELFSLLSELLEPLEDAHIGLEAGEWRFNPKPPPEWVEAYGARVEQYLLEHYHGGPGVTVTGGGMLAYQSLDERVGYIHIAAMAGFSEGEQEEEVDAEAAGRAMDEALAALADKEALVIDVRFNIGGYDSTSLAIASRFADRERLAFTKKTRAGEGFTPSREYRFAPAGARQFTRPVYLLTSNLTVSAGEIFTMAMGTLPHVNVVGERTTGAHSDILPRHLPNGWAFSLSNQVYTAPDGQVYERVGLPPDVELPLDAPALVEGSDRILEEALRLAATPGASRMLH
ncbi:S41 family peptidase [Archangium violaceum]|uniref:S41 family peptidase n=1 Tax=Archangium violaceum TaxID=83451 RepID=UPI00193B126F|nr:S41 family peptidase [Archangium violaceum]QRK10899.1 S41 family peptidase [Archangium violaceum]